MSARDESPAFEQESGFTRRRMVAYLLAAPTIVAAARWTSPAGAAIPSVQVVDNYDLSDLVADSARATHHLLTVTVNKDGTATFDLPRAEVGQGITTAIGMIIADEMNLPVEKVHITLADARPELIWNQLTGGSNTIHTLYQPVRTAAAGAREQLVQVAAERLGVSEYDLVTRKGMVIAPDGRRLSYGSLAEAAAVQTDRVVRPRLKRAADQRVVGSEQRRTDARVAVTGKKVFAMDLDVKDALPTMVCRPPTINGSVQSVQNLDAVKAMPGVTHVVPIAHTQFVPGGVAVRAKTFGQCIDAIRALKVTWNGGPVENHSDASVLLDLQASETAMTPALPGEAIENVFTFHFRPGDPLEPNCAVADVRSDSAEVWCCLKMPIASQQQIAKDLGLPESAVKVHVTEGGGSFGRHLYGDAAQEAAAISKAMGKPVKLMWHRADSFRQGRVHPMAISRVRVVHSGGQVVSLDQRHTSVCTDWSHGFGEMLTANAANPPGANLGYSQLIFNLTANVAYNYGAVTQVLQEVFGNTVYNTSAVRNIYNPDVVTANELMTDQLAQAMGKDPLDFRIEFAQDERTRGVLTKLKTDGGWGRSLPAGVAQGVAVASEYKGRAACLVELDTRPETVNRKVEHAYTGPRVTRVAFAVDVGLAINPLGLKAQMMGGTLDGICQCLSYSLHLKDGYFLEASWDDANYMRQWNTPTEFEVFVLPPTTNVPGGAGELAVGPAMAATACAVARATGKVPTSFPLNHATLGFTPFPNVPPIPQSPTDGKSPH